MTSSLLGHTLPTGSFITRITITMLTLCTTIMSLHTLTEGLGLQRRRQFIGYSFTKEYFRIYQNISSSGYDIHSNYSKLSFTLRFYFTSQFTDSVHRSLLRHAVYCIDLQVTVSKLHSSNSLMLKYDREVHAMILTSLSASMNGYTLCIIKSPSIE